MFMYEPFAISVLKFNHLDFHYVIFLIGIFQVDVSNVLAFDVYSSKKEQFQVFFVPERQQKSYKKSKNSHYNSKEYMKE